jgi:hypothetical protein
MTEYQAYKMYLALRNHFQTDEYDAIKMRGRIRASKKTFAEKEGVFKKLVKQYRDEEIADFFVANFVDGNRWGGVYDSESASRYRQWLARRESLRYRFEQDLHALEQECVDAGINNIMDALVSNDGQHPLIVRAYLRKTMSVETLVILNKLCNWIDPLDQVCGDTLIWPDLRRLIRKYSPFLKIKEDEYRRILGKFTGPN